jgi:hypothetical protein
MEEGDEKGRNDEDEDANERVKAKIEEEEEEDLSSSDWTGLIGRMGLSCDAIHS